MFLYIFLSRLALPKFLYMFDVIMCLEMFKGQGSHFVNRFK
jgi:hypothetical protein